MKRKICYVSGTRADYGLMRPVLFALRDYPGLDVEVIATGMHLMNEFGRTIHDIEKDGFAVHVANAVYARDDRASMATFIGACVVALTKRVQDMRPDIILVIGDRGEMLAAAIVGVYLGIPVAHVHGGEVTSTIDEFTRHAITKLAHIHFPTTKKAGQRILMMGEERWRIHVMGAPGLDMIQRQRGKWKDEEIYPMFHLDPRKPLAIIAQHPVSGESAGEQMRETLEAVKELGLQSVVIYPNADAGGRKMIEVIESYRGLPSFSIIKSMPHQEFVRLMHIADVMIGNSSSGIIEAPTLRLPVVNVGARQHGRERGDNVIDVPCEKQNILKAVRRTLTYQFRKKLSGKNPYGDGKTGPRIARHLAELVVDARLLQKQLTY